MVVARVTIWHKLPRSQRVLNVNCRLTHLPVCVTRYLWILVLHSVPEHCLRLTSATSHYTGIHSEDI